MGQVMSKHVYVVTHNELPIDASGVPASDIIRGQAPRASTSGAIEDLFLNDIFLRSPEKINYSLLRPSNYNVICLTYK